MFESIFLEATPEQPVSLLDIIFYLDRHERIIPTHQELQSALKPLCTSGLIYETAPGKYVRNHLGQNTRTFSDISEEQYRQALAEYDRIWQEFRTKADRPA